jgi:hypothetical protein
MASSSEVGNLKNVTNFGSLVSFATSYGASYAPSNPAIFLAALTAKKTQAEANLESVKDTEIPLNKLRGIRRNLFEPLKPLATRIVGVFQSSGASKETIEKAISINRKIQGKRAPSANKTNGETTVASETISISQQSYDRQADFFQELIKLAELETTYNPSETDLKIVGLNMYQQELITANQAVINAYPPYNNAVIAQDETLYAPASGLVDLAYTTKNYIKSAFGAASPQYKQVSGIKFTRSRK